MIKCILSRTTSYVYSDLLVPLVAVSLSLERDIPVCLSDIEAVERYAHQPFQDIPQVEEHPEHFKALPSVNSLVVIVLLLQPMLEVIPHEENAEEEHRLEALEWYKTIQYDLHG